MKLDTMQDLFTEELHDLYSAEQQLTEALPKMAQAASNDELREAFEHHLQETQDHVRRLDDIYGELGISPSGEKCEAMEGLIAEGEELIQAEGDPNVKDAALIARGPAGRALRDRRVRHHPRARQAARPRAGRGAPRPDAGRGEQRRQAAEQDRHRRAVRRRHQRARAVLGAELQRPAASRPPAAGR